MLREIDLELRPQALAAARAVAKFSKAGAAGELPIEIAEFVAPVLGVYCKGDGAVHIH